MAKPKTDSRPITVTLSQEIWESLDAEKAKRPYDSVAEIIRDRLRTTLKSTPKK